MDEVEVVEPQDDPIRLIHHLAYKTRRGLFDFHPRHELQQALQWTSSQLNEAVKAAEARGWVRGFGSPADYLGVSLRPAGLNDLSPNWTPGATPFAAYRRRANEAESPRNRRRAFGN